MATLAGQEPLVPTVGAEPDAYADAFARRYHGWGSAAVRVVNEPWFRGRRVLAYVSDDAFELAAEVRPGSFSVEATAAPSIAHVVLGAMLEHEELEALVSGSDAWLRARARVDRLPASQLAGRPFVNDGRSRVAGALASTVLVAAGAGLLVLQALVLGDAPWGEWLCWSSVGLAISLAGLLGLRSVVRHRRARSLAMDVDGFREGHRRVRWEDVELLDDRWGTITWRLPDGRERSAPHDAFLDPHATILALRARCRGGGGAYRGVGG